MLGTPDPHDNDRYRAYGLMMATTTPTMATMRIQTSTRQRACPSQAADRRHRVASWPDHIVASSGGEDSCGVSAAASRASRTPPPAASRASASWLGLRWRGGIRRYSSLITRLSSFPSRYTAVTGPGQRWPGPGARPAWWRPGG